MSVVLNRKDELFCHFVVEGRSQMQAYRDAGFKAKTDASASAAASRKRREPQIVARIQELYKEGAKDLALMKEEKQIWIANRFRDEGVDDRMKIELAKLDNAMQGHNSDGQVKVSGELSLLDAALRLAGSQRLTVANDVEGEEG